MRTCALFLLLLGVVVVVRLEAQTFRLKLDGVSLTYQENREGRQAVGAGGGAGVELRIKKLRFDGRVYAAKMEPNDPDEATYDFAQVDVRAGYAVTPFLTVEAGGGRRYVDPGFAAQEVGFFRLGVASENELNRLSSGWVRGAYLVDNRFSGGGSSDLAFELALGVGVGTANGRFRVHAEYEFQRIDREVNAADVPLQLSLARFGVAFGF